MVSSTPIAIKFAGLTHTGHYADNCPLGVAMVAAFAKEKFGKKINVSMYKHPNALIKDLENEIPQVLCFSSYVWNFRLSYEIASRVKNHSPDTVVVFGGPNFPLTSDEQESFLIKYPSIDFFVFREGEIAFSLLLEELMQNNFDFRLLKNKQKDLPNTFYVGPKALTLEHLWIPSKN